MTEKVHVARVRTQFEFTFPMYTSDLVEWLNSLPEDHVLTYFGNCTPPCFEATWERDLELWDR